MYDRIVTPTPRYDSLAEALWSRVRKTEGCWEWTGSQLRRRYGIFSFRGTNHYAHRTAWELAFGPIPADKRVLHRCDNPPCCRPDHLFLGTQSENLLDMMAKGRRIYPTKHSDKVVSHVRELLALGLSCNAIGIQLGISDSTVYDIREGRTRR
jgi:hypothetical protein